MPRRGYIVIAATVCAIALGIAACGSGTHHNASDPSTKETVVTEASLGYGAFHRYILVPARAGHFSDPGSPVVANAGAAAHFASQHLRVAARHARGSNQLRVLFAPLELTADKISALRGTLSKQHAVAQIEAVNEILRRIAAAARTNGARIVEAPAAQIAAAGGPGA